MTVTAPAQARVENPQQRVAVFWLAAHLASLFGILALPIFAGEPTALDAGGEVGPFLLLAAVVLGLGIAGRSSATLSGAAAGVVALVSIVLTLVITIGVVFTLILDDINAPIDWGAGVFATISAAVCGLIAVVTSGRGWSAASPRSWTPVTVAGAAAVVAMTVGLVIPENDLTLSDTLGFSVHPVVGIGFTTFIASLAAVGVAGFMFGRWGIGLLAGFLGYIFVGWLTSQSDQSTAFSWSGVGEGSDFHGLTVAGFWTATALFVVHVVQQYSSSPTTRAAATGATPTPPGSHVSRGSWNPDPFGRHELRYFDGEHWTQHVSTDGEQSTDAPVASPPDGNERNWHPDPFGRHDHRFFDGARWTRQVSDAGDKASDPPTAPPPETDQAADDHPNDDEQDSASAGEPERTSKAGRPGQAWAEDPFGRFELRYFDGRRWTDHVSSSGEQATDPAVATPPDESEAGWYADPFGRHDHRYFDGTRWSHRVATAGVTATDRAVASPPEE